MSCLFPWKFIDFYQLIHQVSGTSLNILNRPYIFSSYLTIYFKPVLITYKAFAVLTLSVAFFFK